MLLKGQTYICIRYHCSCHWLCLKMKWCAVVWCPTMIWGSLVNIAVVHFYGNCDLLKNKIALDSNKFIGLKFLWLFIIVRGWLWAYFLYGAHNTQNKLQRVALCLLFLQLETVHTDRNNTYMSVSFIKHHKSFCYHKERLRRTCVSLWLVSELPKLLFYDLGEDLWQ